MKRLTQLLAITTFLLVFTGMAQSDPFVSGSTGADGAFNPTATTEVQLPVNGIFNFTTVNIPAGVTVTFKKNAMNTPVYILATGDVTIAGTLKVDGANSLVDGTVGKGGPGGFDGGKSVSGTGQPGKGLGPGGGSPASSTCSAGGGGGFGSAGGTNTGTNCGAGGPVYGNPEAQPLIGGSGGGGGYNCTFCGGGGSGGAILIASSGTVTISGSLTANGGSGYHSNGGGGSGGSIRVIANTISGNGTIDAKGGNQAYNNKGGSGRIRLETYTANRTAGPVYVYAIPGSVFLTNAPSLSITSVGGVTVPATPTGSLSQPDIWLPTRRPTP